MQAHSFVIPAYRDSPFLESCIQSLLAQSMKSEIILTTSTPTPFIEGLAQQYGLPYFINEAPSSIAGDWNFALAKASHSLVTIAHQDDIYDPNYVAAIVEALNKKPKENILIAFSNYADLVNNELRGFSLNAMVKSILLFPFTFSKSLKSSFFKKAILSLGDPICCPAVTLNLAAIGTGFKFSTAYTCALDWHAWLELAKQQGSFLYIDQKLLQHRIHVDSETTQQISNGKRQQEELQLFEQLWGKTIAKLISKIYAIGHKDNRI